MTFHNEKWRANKADYKARYILVGAIKKTHSIINPFPGATAKPGF